MAQAQEGSSSQPGGNQRGGQGRGNARQRSLTDDPTTGERTAQQRGSAEMRRAGEIARGGGNYDGRGGNTVGGEWNLGPLRGEGFVEWSDRLRNVEEMLSDPDLRAEVARVREIARGIRVEFRRHSKEPEWDMVKTKIGDALAQLRDRVSEELARKGSKEALVPVDRDPVPGKFGELVRRYYEDLSKSQ
jgi:hypothetical protein